MIKTRAQLKEDFSNGCMPAGGNFAALIDSLVHRDELLSETFKASEADNHNAAKLPCISDTEFPLQLEFDKNGNVLICQQETILATFNVQQQQWILTENAKHPTPLAVNGWLQAVGRVGGYDPSTEIAKNMASADAAGTLQVDADGKWHSILPNLYGCHAFEIVAHASGKQASGGHAMLHAIVLTSFSGRMRSIKKTRVCKGWAWRWNLQLKWRKRPSRWFQPATGYDLCLKSRCDYGIDDAGYKVLIQYHITRLW